MGLFDIFSPDQGIENAEAGYGLQTAALERGERKGVGAINKGVKKGKGYYGDIVDLYSGITDQQQAGYDMYQAGLGLKGQEGYDAALGAFQQGPGFQFALDQANQNVLRNNAALGGLGSGNTLMALQDRAQQMQNQEYGNWLNHLRGFDPMRGAEGQARGLTALGDMFVQSGRDKANIYTSMAQPMAQAGYDLYANINNAQQAANNNSWGALLGGLNTAGQVAGSGGFWSPGGVFGA